MTLDEAIAHCNERAEQCDACGAEHKQLAIWLKELKVLRQHTSLAKIKEEAWNRENVRFSHFVFTMLKSIWASNNALNEEERFPKLSEKWKARAESYRKEAEILKQPEEESIDTSWLAHLLICEYDDGLKEAVDNAIWDTKEYIKTHPEE